MTDNGFAGIAAPEASQTPSGADFRCPACGGTQYRRSPYWETLHFILNPVFAIFEIFLGWRLPRLIHTCKTCSIRFLYSDFGNIPCPRCRVSHSSLLWSGQNGWGHWFGYLCPACGATIPCLWNLTSLVLLAVTAPLWYLPVRLVRRRWLAYEKQRLLRRAAALADSVAMPVIPDSTLQWLWVGVTQMGIRGAFLPSAAWAAFESVVGDQNFAYAFGMSATISLVLWPAAGGVVGFVDAYRTTHRLWKPGRIRFGLLEILAATTLLSIMIAAAAATGWRPF